MDAYETGYDAGSAAERIRLIKLLMAERKNYVFNSQHAWILDETIKLIQGDNNGNK